MTKPEALIFDMDGCLYPLDRGSGKSFAQSQFGQSIKASEIAFVQAKLNVAHEAAVAISGDLKNRYNRHLSIALEREHNIPREEFFASTWDLDPANYIDAQPNLPQTLGGLSIRSGLLTAAPAIWTHRVLDHLQVRTFFEPYIRCGNEDVRKPDPQAFQQTADMLGVAPQNVISIGDQEHTDIVPAKMLGMLTVRIGDDTHTTADFLAPTVADAINQLTDANLL